jgi:hypothetical protein
MKYMLIFLCFPFCLFAGDRFIDSVNIHYPDNFSKRSYDELVNKIGYVYPPFSTVEHTKTMEGKTLFTARYKIEQYGLRLPAETSKESKKNFHLILDGDSNVFGEGCNEEATLTSQLEKKLTNFHLYNFGHRGGAPHNTLSLIENYPFQNLIAEKKGIFIYDFFTTHMIERVIGGKNYIAWDNGLSPWYDFDEINNTIVYKGQLKEKTSSKIYARLSKYSLFNWLFPVLPRITQTHIKLVSKIFAKMKKDYLQSFPEGRFIVLINDTVNDEYDIKTIQLTRTLHEELEKENIETIWPGHQKINSLDAVTFKDGHFNPEGQKWQAGIIFEQLKSLSFSSDMKL